MKGAIFLDRGKVSLIVPIYNKSATLKRCVESILNQEYQNLEIILVDDGSLDNSFDICSDYAEKDARVKVFKKENGGVSSARNLGLKMACGEFVQFVDADDFLEKDMCSKMMESCFEKDFDVVICSYKKHDGDKIKNKTLLDFECEKISQFKNEFEFLFENAFFNSPCNKLYKREKIKSLFDENFSIGEDLLFNLEYFKNCEKIKIISNCFYNYVDKSENSLSKLYDEDLLDKQIKLYGSVRNFCENKFQDTFLDGGIDRVFLKEIYYILKKIVYHDKLSKKEKISKIKNVLERKELKKIPQSLKINDSQVKIVAFMIRKKLKYSLFIFFKLKNLLRKRI